MEFVEHISATVRRSRTTLKVHEYYDKLSGCYNELYGREQAAKHDKALGWIKREQGGVLVDVGCGDGMLLSKIEDYSLTVGVDTSLAMLRTARSVLSGKSQLVCADHSYLPFRSAAADMVVSVSVADLGSARALVGEASRIARPGSSIVVSIFHVGRPAPLTPRLSQSQGPVPVLVDKSTLTTHETMYHLKVPE